MARSEAPASAPAPTFTPPAPPAPDIASSPAVQDAIRAAVAEALSKQSAGSELGSIFRELATEIARMNDVNAPHGSTPRLPPEVAERRARAQAALNSKLAVCIGEGVWPRYRVLSTVYLNEVKIPPFVLGAARGDEPKPTQIEWQGEPNDAMVPLNEAAQEIFSLFVESRGGAGAGSAIVRGQRRMHVNPAGLLIEGRAPSSTRTFRSEYDPGTGLRVDGGKGEVHVLGTVAPPAMHNYQGKPA